MAENESSADEKSGSNISKAKKKLCVLVAEDDREMRGMLTQALQKEGYRVIESPSGIDLLERLSYLIFPEENGAIDLVITDIRMPGFTGLEILEGLHQRKGCPPMILITAFGDEMTHKEAKRCGAVAVYDKPFDVEELVNKVAEVLPLRK